MSDTASRTFRVLQFVFGVLVIASICAAWLVTPSLVNRIMILRDREKYVPDVFTVTGAEYPSDGITCWLNGTVGEGQESLVPDFPAGERPQSAADLLARYPVATKLPVLYNRDATHVLVQHESLRVKVARPDFWQREAELIRFLVKWFVPLTVTLPIYVILRVVNWRRRASSRPPLSAG